MAGFPVNYYSTNLVVGGSSDSTSNSQTLDFGFNASYLRVENWGVLDAYADLRGCAASTAGVYLRACGGRLELNAPPPVGHVSLTTTTTSTSVSVGVLALAR